MSLRTGVCGGVRVRLGRLSEMVNTSKIESLDFLVSTENSDVEDWHSVLKADLQPLVQKNYMTETGGSERSREESARPRRRRSQRDSDSSRSKSPHKSPLTSPFFTEEASYADFKLQAHVETGKSRAGAVSPVRGLARERSLAGLLSTDAPPSEVRRPSISFEVSSDPTPTVLAAPASCLDLDGHESVSVLATSSLAEHFDSRPVVDEVPNIVIPSAKSELLTLTLYDSTNFEHAIDLLRVSSNLFDQVHVESSSRLIFCITSFRLKEWIISLMDWLQ